MNDIQETCVFHFETILGEHVCCLGNTWPCETDATVCGDYEQRQKGLEAWM